jgi:hypothetical protein
MFMWNTYRFHKNHGKDDAAVAAVRLCTSGTGNLLCDQNDVAKI